MSSSVPVGPDEFVNPYTFVPFPKGEPADGWKSAPAGHERLADGRFSGAMDVEITARSPLLLRNVYASNVYDSGEEGEFPRRHVPGFAEPQPYLPGSSLAGTIRSLHEAIAGGCLRVFNDSFIPGYRDHVKGQDAAWRLALVKEVDEKGAPERLHLCRERTVWVDSDVLHCGLGGPEQLRSGVRVELAGEAVKSSLGRWELSGPGAAATKAEDGDVVVLVTDAKTRNKTRKNPDDHGPGKLHGRYFCATGELEGPVRNAHVHDDVWQNYLHAVSGSRDIQEAQQTPAAAPDMQTLVLHPASTGKREIPLGYRDRAARELREGQVVWVRAKLTDDAVVVNEIALAAIWRHQGAGAAGKRVPSHLRACADPRMLCPSCRLFGSVDADGGDASGDGQGGAQQRAYRGHVRFSDAIPSVEPETDVQYLPPMGAPKPGAGQSYLARDERLEGDTARTEGEPPLREWGSRDENGHRRLRGRKHYWLTSRPEERPYFRAENQRKGLLHEHHKSKTNKNKMISTAESVRRGAVFTARVSFENLTAAELGGLLCALDPDLLLSAYDRRSSEQDDGEREPVRYGWAVGGGRPLGFGTCTTRVEVSALDSAESRYLGAERPEVGTDAMVDAFRRSVPKELGEVWKRLAPVLRLDWAPADRVWYPPAGLLPGPGERVDPGALDASFNFWNQSAGAHGKNRGTPYQQFPVSNSPRLGMKVVKQARGDA